MLRLHLSHWRAAAHHMQQARGAAAARLQRVQQAAWLHLLAAMLHSWRHAAQRLKQLRGMGAQVAARRQQVQLQQVGAQEIQ